MIVQAWTYGEGDLCDICWANIEDLTKHKSDIQEPRGAMAGHSIDITFLDGSEGVITADGVLLSSKYIKWSEIRSAMLESIKESI